MHHLVVRLAFAATCIAVGALETLWGRLGVALIAVDAVGLVVLQAQALKSRTLLEKALDEAGIPASQMQPYPRMHVVFPRRAWRRDDINIERDVKFAEVEGEDLYLDVFTRTEKSNSPDLSMHGRGRPVLLSVHGGAWKIGHRQAQGIPLLGHMAAHGWVGFNVDYRLSPRWALPAHLVDLKRAVAWIREHASEYGLDPSFIAVAGPSAGAHLAALLALTDDDSTLQPGFEHEDTSVQAVACTYGVYDVTTRNRLAHADLMKFMQDEIIQRSYLSDPEAFVRVSPIERIGGAVPPFFVVHGTNDTITPVDSARAFVQRMRSHASSWVAYAELPGAQHAFDVFPSVRSVATIDAAARFLDGAYRRHCGAPDPTPRT